MYEQHFGFQGMPFSASPADWKFFQSESTSAVIPNVLHSLQSNSGVAVVTGPEGVGKTVLLHRVQAELARQGQAIILPATSLRSADDLYICIRRSLKTLDGQTVSGGSGRWEVVERLQGSVEFWGPIGLLVDDAQLLTPELFGELQFLLEQRSSSQTLCRLLLAGTHGLEETLAQPALSGFAQRIRTFGFLQPLRLAESVEYLRSRLSHVGGDIADCFAGDAVEAIVEAADGSPRCLDVLADESLLVAFHNGQRCTTRESVETALAGLQHLPHAWNISVSHHEEASLDDTATSQAGWQSSSDGVIEIGAAPDNSVVEIGESMAPAEMPEVIPSVEISETEISEAPSEETESLDDLPSLDDLARDSWLDEIPVQEESSVTESASADAEGAADVSADDRSFEAGYLLAAMESVGEPAVEIDEELDHRLLQAAGAADESAESTLMQETVRLEELLTSMDIWRPAGAWSPVPVQCDEVIRGWKIEHESARPPADIAEAVETLPELTVAEYTTAIPAAQEPVPVWPPETSMLGPGNSIPVTVTGTPPDSSLDDQPSSESAPHDVEPAVMDAPQHAPTVAPSGRTHERWDDGQLLHDLQPPTVPSMADEQAEDEPAPAVQLRIAEQFHAESDQSTDKAQDSQPEDRPPQQNRMFTLPVALDEVTGECAPLARTVRELSEELESFRDSNGNGSSPIGQSAESDDTPAGTEVTGELSVEEDVDEAATDGLELKRPLLLREARRMMSAAAPAQRLRQAAGAENSVFSEEPRPALTVTGWQDDPEPETPSPGVPQAPQEELKPNGFRNLFTRLRGQR